MRLRNSLNQPLRMMRASDKCLRLSAKLMPQRLLSNTRTMCHCVAVSLLMLLLTTAAVSTLTCGGGVDCAAIRESASRLPTKMMIGLTYDETKYLPSDPNWKGRIPAWIGLDGRMRVPPSPQSQIMTTTTRNKELSAAGSHVDDYGVIVPIGGGGAAADNDDEAAVMQEFVPSLRWASAGLQMQEDKRADRNDNIQRSYSSSSSSSSSSSRGMRYQFTSLWRSNPLFQK